MRKTSVAVLEVPACVRDETLRVSNLYSFCREIFRILVRQFLLLVSFNITRRLLAEFEVCTDRSALIRSVRRPLAFVAVY